MDDCGENAARAKPEDPGRSRRIATRGALPRLRGRGEQGGSRVRPELCLRSRSWPDFAGPGSTMRKLHTLRALVDERLAALVSMLTTASQARQRSTGVAPSLRRTRGRNWRCRRQRNDWQTAVRPPGITSPIPALGRILEIVFPINC